MTGACEQVETTTGSVNELGVDNVGGIFLVLLIGIIIGGLLAVGEVYWLQCKKNSKLI